MFRRPQRSQVCASVVRNDGIVKIMLEGHGKTQPEHSYFDWELEQGEKIEEGRTYRIVLMPDDPQ
jgi:hypothetical protein